MFSDCRVIGLGERCAADPPEVKQCEFVLVIGPVFEMLDAWMTGGIVLSSDASQ